MARKKPANWRRSEPAAPTFPKSVTEEPDPEWRRWFREVEQRRRDRAVQATSKWVHTRIQKEDGAGEFFRKKSVPTLFGKCLKRDEKKSGRKISPDLVALMAVWEETVGTEIAAESSVYSFKNGVLTINVFTSALLQEIRQFHQAALEQDIRDAWTLPVPLIRIVYRLGKRQ